LIGGFAKVLLARKNEESRKAVNKRITGDVIYALAKEILIVVEK